MKSHARLTLAFDSPEVASVLAEAVSEEPTGERRVRRRGRILVVDANADEPMALLRTVDNCLARINAAERTAGQPRPAGHKRRRRV